MNIFKENMIFLRIQLKFRFFIKKLAKSIQIRKFIEKNEKIENFDENNEKNRILVI